MNPNLSHELLNIRKRHLHELEKQQAHFGLHTPPHITLEIEQLRTEIERLLRYSYVFTLQREVLDQERPPPMPGLVALVSPETVPAGPATLTQAAYHAIDYHRSALRHCWFVASTGERGSLAAAQWLTNYCEQRNIAAQVWQVQDPADTAETFGLVQWLFTVAIPERGLDPQDVIADMTGATKPMSIGMWLACQGNHRVQYMTRQHDGLSVPLLVRLVHVDPKQQEQL